MYDASMNSISSARVSATNASPAGATSHLGAMDDAMARVARHAQLDTPGDAAAVLATGDEYVEAGRKAIAGLDTQLLERSARLQQASAAGASQGEVAAEREQLHLMTMLRDRIALSIERVSDMLRESDERSAQDARQVRRARDGQVLLEGYDALRAQLVVVPGLQRVAATYSRG